MPFRISDSTLFANAVRHTRINRFELSRVQAQIASGKRLVELSDAPDDAARVLNLRAATARVEQYGRNIDAARARLEPTEAALASLTDVLIRLRELAVSADIEDFEYDQIVPEVEELYSEVLRLANSHGSHGYLFGGFATDAPPFAQVGAFLPGVVDEATPDPDVVYNGDAGVVRVQIGEATTIQINLPGSEVFEGDALPPAGTDPGRVNLFDVARELRNRLVDPANAAFAAAPGPLEMLDELDLAIDQVVDLRGRLGGALNRLDLARAQLDSLALTQQVERSGLEDLDLIAASTELQSREATFQASLAVTARVLQPSLLDFLS